MSVRESISGNLISVLDSMTSPTLGKITREPFEPDELSIQQFPAAFVQTSTEQRQDITIKNTGITRTGEIDFLITGFVKNNSASTENIDTQRNVLITGIETALDSDRTRGGNALDTQVISIETDEGMLFPFGGVSITIRCLYEFNQGTP
tara:strand:- start:1492 stop:1938 length:447 start_codon:yes stop_codon:yes gene_type:complete